MPSAGTSVPITTSVSYATTQDLLLLKDSRQCADMLDDTGLRVSGTPTLQSNAIMNKVLLLSSGMVESACLRGNRYSVSDLQALNGAARELLVAIVVELAYWRLYKRRHPGKPMPEEAQWAFGQLEALNDGETIFPLTSQADAGNPQSGFMSCGDWSTLSLATDVATRLFGANRAKFVLARGGLGWNGGCGCDGGCD